MSGQKEMASWLKSFNSVYKVTGGENLKNFSHLESHLNKILKIKDFQKETAIIAVGGGSVGDFAGFVASVLRRGVGLVHIPTTWLAAIDSSHGGKTALNFKTHKNQIGSFYQAHHVFLCKSVLLNITNKELLFCALGELFKMALLEGGVFYRDLVKVDFTKYSPEKMSKLMLKYLKPAVEAKYKVVKKDPRDKYQRHILNLGHTIGHVIELNKKVNHGVAVAKGTRFATEWSARKKLLSNTKKNEILSFLDVNFGKRKIKITSKQAKDALL
ncbi:hypothetical protein N9W41_01540, partial [bacterium]|nr:hypothetical protein [bacterium]